MKRVPETPAKPSCKAVSPKSGTNLLTIMVEDYFHVGAFENLIQQRNWKNFEPRYEQNTIKTLDLLDLYNTKATFFVLGWIAESNPALVREISARGHEVASLGFYHRGPGNLTPDEFREDLRRTNQVIESATGRQPLGYRAPEKLSFESSRWVLDILAEEGFDYDASFLPTVGTKPPERVAHLARTPGGNVIWEFPYSALDLAFGMLSISGGNYFRQLPYTLMRHAVKGWHKHHDDPFMFYFHVWELDPEQPRISAASKISHIRHYRKLDKWEWILHENLALYNCTGIAHHLGLKDPLEGEQEQRTTAPKLLADISTGNDATRTPISIVIPCYNEQESLPYLANTLGSVGSGLRAAGYEPNLIFVDDKSTDNTLDVIQTHFGDQGNVRVLRHDANKGVAAGIVTGLAAAETEIVVSMDCDCTYDPHSLVNMLPLMADGVDLVTASPYHREGRVRNVPGWRLFLSRGASALYRRVLRANLDTYTSCFRIYRRSAFLNVDITESGFLGVAEMLGRLYLDGGKIVEFPAVLEVRLFGISKMKTVKTILGHIRLLTRLAKLRLFRKFAVIETSLREKNITRISEKPAD